MDRESAGQLRERPAREVLRHPDARADLLHHPPLPAELHDPPDAPLVSAPTDEPLVTVRHHRIVNLQSYRAAGWRHVHHDTWLRATVADRLYRVADTLPPGWGLCVFDAWRPLALQQELYQATYIEPADDAVTPPPGFLAEPSTDPRTPPPHLTGGTVDLSLTFEGIPLTLGTVFDDFTSAAHTRSLEGTGSVEEALRRRLYWAMRSENFVVLHQEWWHFEIGTRRWAAITGHDPFYGPAAPPDGAPDGAPADAPVQATDRA